MCIALAIASGCASIQNTPKQEYVWELGHICDTTTMRMERVDPDGRYWVQGASNIVSLDPYLECMEREQQRLPYDQWLKAKGK